MANINAGPVSLFKVPFYAADGSVPSEGDVLYRGLDGLPTWGSAALVARSLESKADLAAIQAMATISRAKVYYAADTGKQYMWTGGGVTTAWEVAEVNSGLALGETSATAFAGDKGAELYALKGNIPTTDEKTRLSDIQAAAGTTTNDKITALSVTGLETLETFSYLFSDWISGGINSAGADYALATGIRTSGYHKIGSDKITITPAPGYKYRVAIYSYDESTYTLVYTSSAYTTTPGTISVNPNYYYRFTVAQDTAVVVPTISSLAIVGDNKGATKRHVREITDLVLGSARGDQYLIDYYDWEPNTISATGANGSGTDAIRTSGYHKIPFDRLVITCASGYKFRYCAYSLNAGVYTLQQVNSAYQTNEASLAINKDWYYRFSIATTDASVPSLSVSDYLYLSGTYVKEIEKSIIVPKYEYIQIPNSTTFYWSDFCVINIGGVDELWVFSPSTGEEHATANGAIRRFRMSDWTLIAKYNHDFGHVNTVNYDSVHDRLIIGNAADTPNTTYPTAVYIFDDVSDWTTTYANDETIYFSTACTKIVDLSGLTAAYSSELATALGTINAAWGEPNGANQNIIYVTSGHNKDWFKLFLGTGTNQLTYGTYAAAAAGEYNGTFNVLWHYAYKWANAAAHEDTQGIDFANGKIWTVNGHDYLLGYKWHLFSDGLAREKMQAIIYDDAGIPLGLAGGTDMTKVYTEGLCVHDGYIYIGYVEYATGSGRNDIVRFPIF